MLGINWDNKSDLLVFDIDGIFKTPEKLIINKQKIKILLLSVILKPRIILKGLFVNRYNWDDEVDDESYRLWISFLNQFSLLKIIVVDGNVSCS